MKRMATTAPDRTNVRPMACSKKELYEKFHRREKEQEEEACLGEEVESPPPGAIAEVTGHEHAEGENAGEANSR
jgi:hypothetical protein